MESLAVATLRSVVIYDNRIVSGYSKSQAGRNVKLRTLEQGFRRLASEWGLKCPRMRHKKHTLFPFQYVLRKDGERSPAGSKVSKGSISRLGELGYEYWSSVTGQDAGSTQHVRLMRSWYTDPQQYIHRL